MQILWVLLISVLFSFSANNAVAREWSTEEAKLAFGTPGDTINPELLKSRKSHSPKNKTIKKKSVANFKNENAVTEPTSSYTHTDKDLSSNPASLKFDDSVLDSKYGRSSPAELERQRQNTVQIEKEEKREAARKAKEAQAEAIEKQHAEAELAKKKHEEDLQYERNERFNLCRHSCERDESACKEALPGTVSNPAGKYDYSMMVRCQNALNNCYTRCDLFQ